MFVQMLGEAQRGSEHQGPDGSDVGGFLLHCVFSVFLASAQCDNNLLFVHLVLSSSNCCYCLSRFRPTDIIIAPFCNLAPFFPSFNHK